MLAQLLLTLQSLVGPGTAPAPVIDLRGDMDGDHCNDILLAGVQRGGDYWFVYAAVYSGRTGELMHCVRAGMSGSAQPMNPSARIVGDVDGDGGCDYGLLWAEFDRNTNCLQLRSGRDGHLLTEWKHSRAYDVTGAKVDGSRGIYLLRGAGGHSVVEGYLLGKGGPALLRSVECVGSGMVLRALEDLDGDSCDEPLIGMPCGGFSSWSFGDPSWVRQYASRDGAVQTRIEGRHCEVDLQDQLGQSLEPCGDFDGDGKEDFLAVAPGGDPLMNSPGYVLVCSGSDGSVLQTFGDPRACGGTTYLASPAGDMNHDGRADVLVARGTRDNDSPAELRFLSAGAENGLPQLQGLDLVHDHIDVVAGGGDCDGDLIPDFVVGGRIVCQSSGELQLRSGRDGAVLRTIPIPPLPSLPTTLGK